ncbi:MAG TPA: SulP family inorganic anion transporter [Planctomycetaceae bacterium]|nr:SulP family inorganic anion transporter [Planctomycetaceae bacterium]
MIRQQEKQIRELATVISKVHESMLQEKREADVVAAAEEAADQMRFALQMLQEGDTIAIRKSLEEVEAKLEYVFSTLKSHDWAAKVGLLTIVVLVLWNSLIPKKYRVIPAPLVAVIAGTVFAAILSLPIIFVEVPDNLWDAVMLPTWTTISTVPWFAVVQAGVVLAVVASAETLLCATAVDRMQSLVRTNYDRELAAQGIGNIVCGLLGALPMTGVIVRSSANVDAGARTRLSTILHGLWLLVFVSLAAALLRMIPTASLAAILVYTGYKLVNWKTIFELRKYGWGEVVVYVVTLSTIVATDLLTGVLTGVFLSAGKLLLTFARLDVHLRLDPDTTRASLDLDGAATFLSLPRLAETLEQVPPDAELHVDFEHLTYIDHACLDLLMNWAKQHEQTGGRLVIDWNTLHSVMSGRNHSRNAGLSQPEVAAREATSG